MFQDQTIATLMARTVVPAPTVAVTAAPAGSVARTPIQHWFADQQRETPQHFNQSVLLFSGEPLERTSIEKALSALVAHHDALRSRVRGAEQWIEAHETNTVMADVDLVSVSQVKQHTILLDVSDSMQRSLDMQEGPMLRVALFHLSDGDRLLFIIHHWVVDGVSWRILLEDFDRAYQQAIKGEPIVLPAKTNSWAEWAQALHGELDRLESDRKFWVNLERASATGVPRDFSDENGIKFHSRHHSHSLECLKEPDTPPRDYCEVGVQIQDALLTAILRAIAKWSGSRNVKFHIEGHGREDLAGHLDVSRTVGWFTSLYPVVLQDLPEKNWRMRVASVSHRLVVYLHGASAMVYFVFRELNRDCRFRIR